MILAVYINLLAHRQVGPIVLDPLEADYTRAVYVSRLSPLGLRFDRDYEAARLASGYCRVNPAMLLRLNWGRVIVYMPPFEGELDYGDLVIAVEGYTLRRLLDLGITPDIVVTDFDYEPEAIVDFDGLVVGHAHGDNVNLFLKYAPMVKGLIPSVQVWPIGCSILIPGFTDGDRAVYLAYYMGSHEVVVRGFNPSRHVKRDDEVKRAKLEVASIFLNRLTRLGNVKVLKY